MLNAFCLLLAVNVPSARGSVILFTLAPIGVPIPMESTIITAVAQVAHRGAVLGSVVAISTLPGITALMVTGVMNQAAVLLAG